MTSRRDIERRIERLEEQFAEEPTRRVDVDREALASLPAGRTADDCVRLVAQMDDVPWHWLEEDDDGA